MDQDVEVPETPAPQFSVYLLEIIKKAQSEHGVLNNDYARYRRYCAHRARRLHKSLKFLHGSNKRFQKRTLDAKAITDERHFHIPLINAERAWAYAQELKVDLSTDRHYFSRKFTHMHRRFRKAALAARELARLASERCDSRTWVEAEGYAAWMHGQYLVEREQQLERAHRLLSRARAIFAKVSTIGSAAQQKACRQLEQEISTGLRTCEYRMERAKPGVRAEAVEAMPDPELSEAQLGDILDGLKADPAAETQEEQTVTIHVWRGEEHEVRDACVAKHVEAANQQLREVEASMDTDDVDIRLAHYTKAIGSLVAAAAAAEQALAAAGPGSAVAPEELIQLKAALEGACVDVTIARHTVAATDSEARFHRAKEQQLAASSKVKPAGKRGQPEELVRLFEMLTKEAQKMDRVGNGLYGTFAEEVLAESAFQVTHFSAARALYVGHHLLSVGKPVPAYGMFERCLHRCEEAAEKFEELQELAKVRAAVLEEEGSGHLPSLLAAAQQLQSHHAHLVQVQMRAQAFRVVARAEQAARTEHNTAKTADHLHRLALEPGAAVPGKSGYLLDTLQEWESNAGSGGKQVRVARTLPQPELVPARPIALDAALAYIQQPDLAQYRPHKEEAASLFNRAAGFFGWGTKK